MSSCAALTPALMHAIAALHFAKHCLDVTASVSFKVTYWRRSAFFSWNSRSFSRSCVCCSVSFAPLAAESGTGFLGTLAAPSAGFMAVYALFMDLCLLKAGRSRPAAFQPTAGANQISIPAQKFSQDKLQNKKAKQQSRSSKAAGWDAALMGR